MDLLIGTLFLILVLIIFTLFTYKAPNGMRAMGALANGYCDILSRSIQQVCWWRSIRNQISRGVRGSAGGLGGVVRAGLTALAIGVSPVYALVIGAPVVAWISYQVSSQGTLSVTL